MPRCDLCDGDAPELRHDAARDWSLCPECWALHVPPEPWPRRQTIEDLARQLGVLDARDVGEDAP